jgi:hypothetical protein
MNAQVNTRNIRSSTESSRKKGKKKGKHALQRHSRGKTLAFLLLEGYCGHQTSIIERDV